ncbi:hypothetical protein [Massilia niabensis]|uniref:Uncharacterized protein n=1 Tax=Massilia niabensis TaxID=544910 RepID=A0ABW0KYX2_9BURK
MGTIKMGKTNYSALFMSFFLLCAGSAFGWAIVSKLVGSHESVNFLQFSGFAATIIFVAQLSAFVASGESLIRRLIFLAMFGLSLVWMMLCLFLPIFWMREVGLVTKSSIAAFALLLFFANAFKGLRSFEESWKKKSPSVNKYYKARERILDWEKLVGSLHLSTSFFIPGAPKWVEPVLSLLLILSMIAGLNLRKVFPVFSIFAWGIPCVIGSSALIQIIAMRVAQAIKVAEIEKEIGEPIRPKLC